MAVHKAHLTFAARSSGTADVGGVCSTRIRPVARARNCNCHGSSICRQYIDIVPRVSTNYLQRKAAKGKKGNS